MESIELFIENRKEDYLPAYPDHKKSIFKRNKWLYIALPLFALFLAGAIVVTFLKPHPKKEEWGVAWTGVTVLAVYLAIKLYELKSRDQKVSKFLKETEAKGPFKALFDVNGVTLNYRSHMVKLYWSQLLEMHVQEQYMAFYGHTGQMILVLPKGKIESAQWVKLESYIIKTSERLEAEAQKGDAPNI